MQQQATPLDRNNPFVRFAGGIGATEAAAFRVCHPGTGNEHLHVLSHVRGGANADAATRQAAVVAFEKIVRPCIAAGTDAAVDLEGSDRLMCLVRLVRDDAAAVVMALAFVVRRTDRERAEAALRRFPMTLSNRPLHNSPMQRTGAAGIVSFVRTLLGRGSGR